MRCFKTAVTDRELQISTFPISSLTLGSIIAEYHKVGYDLLTIFVHILYQASVSIQISHLKVSQTSCWSDPRHISHTWINWRKSLRRQTSKTWASIMMYKMPKFAYHLISDFTHMPACIWISDFFFNFYIFRRYAEKATA